MAVLCDLASLFHVEYPLSVPFLEGEGGSRVQFAAVSCNKKARIERTVQVKVLMINQNY